MSPADAGASHDVPVFFDPHSIGDAMRGATVLCTTALILAGFAPAAAAQDEAPDVSAAAAYFAITATPVGSGPLLSSALTGGVAERRFRGQFGYADEEGDISRRSLLLGIDLPIGGASSAIGIDAGFNDFACDPDEFEDLFGVEVDCGSLMMIGGRWTSRLLSTPMGSSSGAEFQMAVEVGLGASFGEYLTISDDVETLEISATNVAAGATLPLMLVARSGSTTIIPMLAPGFAYGRASQELELDGESEDVTESGTQFVLAAGLGFRLGESALGVDAGIRKVFAEDAPVVVGFGISIQM